MKRMTIKVLAFVLILSSVIVYMACNKKGLNIPPPTQSEDTYFKTESEFRTAMLGTYAVLTDYYSASNGAGGNGNAELQVWFLPGDDLTIGNGSSYEIFQGLSSSNGALRQTWKSSYNLIGRANKILDKLTNAPADVFTTTGLRNYMTGEALFLRAYGHFQLWNIYGTAPVDTIIPKSVAEFNLPASKGVELLNQVIADLNRAAPLLPVSWPATDLGRVTAKGGYGMLGKALTFRASATKSSADYQAAIAAFNKISGASLTANFGDNFDVETENNSESLFEFQAGPNIINQGQNAWLGNDVCDCGVTGSFFQMFYDGAGSYMGGGVYTATTKLQNIYNAADPRLPFTLSADKKNIVKYVRDGGPEDGAVLSLNNMRLLRLSDALLLKAEAVLQSNGSTLEAIGYINEVRTRARGGGSEPANFSTAQTDRTIIMQWIMDERLRELAAEGHRWFDLRRWHMAGYITLNDAFFSSTSPGDMEFQPFNILFPIPNNETDVNPNVPQNFGY